MGGDERGSVAAELTLLVPALVMLLLFVVFCARVADARLRVDDAAHQAARAATLARSPDQADHNARTTAQDALTRAGMSCRGLTVEIRPGAFRPGAMLRVIITCRLQAGDLALLSVPTTIAVSARADSVIDRWRTGPDLSAEGY